jgi:enamine deaminase RidA (YjgF/YER057c/UK114 family)
MTTKLLYFLACVGLMVACQGKQNTANTNADTTQTAQVKPEEVKRYDNPASSILRGVAIPKGKKLFYTSGLVAPLIDSTADVNDAHKRRGTTHTQSINTLTRIRKLLEEAGLQMKDVVYLRVYIAPDTQKGKGTEPDFYSWFKAYGEFFNNEQFNTVNVARTNLGVYRLALPDILIEIEAVAVYPE